MKTPNAMLHDPQSDEILAEIHLLGKPVDTGPLTIGTGRLQCFEVISESDNLQKIWLQRQDIWLSQAQTRQRVRLVSHPAMGNRQAILRLCADGW